MNKKLSMCMSALVLSSTPGALMAQDSDYHPYLSNSLTVSLGAMKSNNSFNVESDLGDDIGDEIDFDDTLNVSDSSTFFNGQIKWKFGNEKKWSVSGQYFSNDATGSTVLTEDVEWDGLTFREGSFVNSGVKLSVARLVGGRSFIKNDQNDFGIGIGIHTL